MIFSKLFGKRNEPNTSGREPDLSDIYKEMLPMCAHGIDADEFPGASGEFGFSQENPIPTNTIVGSTLYLLRLRTEAGDKVSYNRIGSFESEIAEGIVDGYVLTSPGIDGEMVIYISPYQKRNSKRAPSGLKIVVTSVDT